VKHPILLIVDDDHAFLAELMEGLTELGMQCLGATTPSGAVLTFADNKSVDVALIDIHLQGEDGVGLLQKLQLWSADRRVQGIMMTGGSTADNAVRSLRARAADYLNKPVSALEVKRTVDKVRRDAQMPAHEAPAQFSLLDETSLIKIATTSASSRFSLLKDLHEGAWLILVEAFLFQLEGRPLHVNSACIASGSPISTGVRYINELEALGLLFREADPKDRRRTLLRLTERGIATGQAYLRRLRKNISSIEKQQGSLRTHSL